MTLPANWTPGSQFTSGAENSVETAVNNLERLAGMTGTNAAGFTATTGLVQMDSFSGANDDAKLSAAMTYASAQTYPPAIQLPARAITFNTGGLLPYNGMRIIGPNGADGPKNLELGNLQNHAVSLNVGTGTSSWFNATANVSDVYMGNIAFQNLGINAQFWHTSGGANGIYPGQFHSLDFYGFSSIFGNPTTSCLMTQVSFTGHWTVTSFVNTAMNLAFSDCDFWGAGFCNFGTGAAAPATNTPNIILSGGRTRIGNLYLTTNNTWAGINVTGGSNGSAIFCHGGVYEGTAGSPATYPLFNISGGDIQFHGGNFDYLNPAVGVNGFIVQSGGNISLYSPRYQRASAASSTFPFVYQTAGTCMIVDGVAMQGGGEQIQFRQSSGTTVAAPAGQITYH